MSGDWTGTGELTCYGHLNAQVSTPPGSENMSEGKMTCTPIEWPYPAQDLGPEAMFFKPNGGAEFEIWAVSVIVQCFVLSNDCVSGTTMSPTSPGPSAMVTCGIRTVTWAPATAPPTWTPSPGPGVALPGAAAPSPATDVDIILIQCLDISNKMLY